MANTPAHCQNCGADLQADPAGALRCTYCGTVYAPQALQTPASGPNIASETPSSLDKDNNADWIVAVIGFLILIGMVIAKISTSRQEGEAALVQDSIRTAAYNRDTIPQVIDGLATARVEVSLHDREILQALNPVKIDIAGFRKLYRNARKEKSPVEIYLHDKTSPKSEKVNACYVYLTKGSAETSAWFTLQYAAEKWLLLNDATFLFDGKTYEYPVHFEHHRGHHQTWETSDQGTASEQIKALVNIAAAKKAQIKYIGELGTIIADIMPNQQAALQRQLQLYKGLLLGYDQPD
ncbi:hypothetical protein C8P68_10510 [Mucilaginibacter yixingensis]|uniref:Uncharacterized protein n=1 Tax=Mucilaginibacter yixingensis TaxID=1295612 RepID=A0A2T5J7Q9_9SPHI|nr:hypothetical protein [Mucilaginibacter yixingensis]PTQ95505.1 hypothetical protein C8P68_10510 [Mucilaginibacter yixingensis]